MRFSLQPLGTRRRGGRHCRCRRRLRLAPRRLATRAGNSTFLGGVLVAHGGRQSNPDRGAHRGSDSQPSVAAALPPAAGAAAAASSTVAPPARLQVQAQEGAFRSKSAARTCVGPQVSKRKAPGRARQAAQRGTFPGMRARRQSPGPARSLRWARRRLRYRAHSRQAPQTERGAKAAKARQGCLWQCTLAAASSQSRVPCAWAWARPLGARQ